MTYHAAISAELQRTLARVWFERLRDQICAAIELLEQQAPAELFPRAPATFVRKPWTRSSGEGGGVGGFLTDGRLFEKAAVHVSSANGHLTPEIAKTLPGDGKQLDYLSTSISLIIHPRSPRVPAVHMNTRFLVTSQWWFGGGADLDSDAPRTPLASRRRRFGVSRRDAAGLRRARSGLLLEIQGMGGRVLLSAPPRRSERRRRHLLRPPQYRRFLRRFRLYARRRPCPA